VSSSQDDARVHWTASVALTLLGLPLLLEAALLDVSLTRLLAVATVIMAASVLTPVSPSTASASAPAAPWRVWVCWAPQPCSHWASSELVV
jgi:hypothetical protein